MHAFYMGTVLLLPLGDGDLFFHPLKLGWRVCFWYVLTNKTLANMMQASRGLRSVCSLRQDLLFLLNFKLWDHDVNGPELACWRVHVQENQSSLANCLQTARDVNELASEWKKFPHQPVDYPEIKFAWERKAKCLTHSCRDWFSEWWISILVWWVCVGLR